MALQEHETRITRLPFHSNPDILDEICEYLHDEQDGSSELARTSKQNLLWAALTCRAFLEPSLDRLWRSLDSLFPLLRILPSFTQSDGTYVLRGNITPEDWARFEWYARRIRKFCYTRDPDHLDIAMHVYFRIAQLRSTPLLPSLRHLHCPSMSQNDFLISGLCLFLSPSLQTLQFENISNVEDKLCGTVLHTLASDGAQMEKIVFSGKGLSKDTLWMAIRFEHLNSLELSGMGEAVNLEIVERIGLLPWMVDLTIDFTDSRTEALTKDIGLKNLKSLTIKAPVPFVQALLSHITTTQLESFVAVLPSNPTDNKKEFLTKVVDRWKDTLRRVALVHQRLEEFPVEHLDVDVLAPLVPLRRLTYLRLEGYAIELTDDNISDMTNAWPEMDTLILPFISAIHPRPTIASLCNIACRCPKLRYLTIPINTMDLEPFISAQVPHTPAHELHTLTIASVDDPWDLRELHHVARHIDYLFPRLKFLSPYDGHDADRWMEVHHTIQMIQAWKRCQLALIQITQGASYDSSPLPTSLTANRCYSTWISWFLSSKGNEYFCEVDEDFILDRFNLTGLNNEVANYQQALDLITDSMDDDIQDDLRGSLDVQARLLYGLIHARWIITARGLTKMLDKFRRAEFGRCPRVLCASQPLLPVGLTDIPYEKSVKLYCGRCEDLYSPKSSRHGSIDGAYFGTTFPHLLFLVYPTIIPSKSADLSSIPVKEISPPDTRTRRRMREDPEAAIIAAEGGGELINTASVALKAERYRPRIYGFQLSEIAKLQRWQEAVRDRQIARLEALEEKV